MPLEDLTLENTSVVDLTPVRSMPLHTLSLVGTPISDLSQLAGLKLRNVHLSEPSTDLSPLQEMPLETITLPKVSTVINVELLRGMPHLKWIRQPECKPLTPEEFWSIYDSGGFGPDAQ
jgi:hypothetical protein